MSWKPTNFRELRHNANTNINFALCQECKAQPIIAKVFEALNFIEEHSCKWKRACCEEN